MTIRILLVDDSPTFLLAMRLFLLSVPGTTVVGEAHDGAQGLQLADRLQPDLILLDMSMPEMDGTEVARAIQTWSRAPQVIFLSIHDAAAYANAARELGAMAFVNKSDLVPGLLSLIENLVASHTDTVGPPIVN